MRKRLAVIMVSMLATIPFAYSGGFADDEACKQCVEWPNPDGSTCDHAQYDHHDQLHEFKSLPTTNFWSGNTHATPYCGTCAQFHGIVGTCRGDDVVLRIEEALKNRNVGELATIISTSPSSAVFNVHENRIAARDCDGQPFKLFDVPADIALELASE